MENINGYRECHIQPNWLLIYKIDKNELILTAFRTGSHSDLFEWKYSLISYYKEVMIKQI